VREGLPEGLRSTAKTSTSKLPVGPFHIMMPVHLMIPDWRSSVLAPMSSPYQRLGKVGLSTDFCTHGLRLVANKVVNQKTEHKPAEVETCG
jgi:hypothetical protein